MIAKKNRCVEIIVTAAISKHLQGEVEGEIDYWIQNWITMINKKFEAEVCDIATQAQVLTLNGLFLLCVT